MPRSSIAGRAAAPSQRARRRQVDQRSREHSSPGYTARGLRRTLATRGIIQRNSTEGQRRNQDRISQPNVSHSGGPRPMIKRLILTNFKGFEQFTVGFGSETFLVGPNNAGKSTIIAALRAS